MIRTLNVWTFRHHRAMLTRDRSAADAIYQKGGLVERQDVRRLRASCDRRRARSAWLRTTLRIRTEAGVTSTHSSSRMYSSACSKESCRLGMSRTSSSEAEDLMLLSFRSLVGLTSMSSALAFSPTIIPS